MQWLGWFYLVFGLVPSYTVVAYWLTMAALRWRGVCDQAQPASPARHRFVILVPAHNEAAGLPSTLLACRQLDYPASLYQTIVIADNCRDETAQVARQADVLCWERAEPDRAGKGQAIGWALEQIRRERLEFDAYLVLDADCGLEPHALAVADHYLSRGDRALQLNHRVMNCDESPISYAAAVGRTLEYDLFFAPKSPLGLAVILVGTGMVFTRDLLQQIPWQSQSCAEDTEYTARLAEERQPVRFLAGAHVQIRAASSWDELRVQRTRWAQGNLALGRRQALPLLARAMMQRNKLLADFAITLLLQSRPLVLAHLLAVGSVAAIDLMLPASDDLLPLSLQRAAWLLPAFYAAYLLSGVLRLGLTARRCGFLLQAPLVLAHLMTIAAVAMASPAPSQWQRTPRPDE